jgi:hypothetical protein
MFPSCLKGINLNTAIKYHDFLWASRVKSAVLHMFCISKTRADRRKLVLFLESAGQIYPETGLTFEAPKCVLASVIHSKNLMKINFFGDNSEDSNLFKINSLGITLENRSNESGKQHKHAGYSARIYLCIYICIYIYISI